MAGEAFEAALNAVQEGDELRKAEGADLLQMAHEQGEGWFEEELQQGQHLAQARALLGHFAAEEPGSFDAPSCFRCARTALARSPPRPTS